MLCEGSPERTLERSEPQGKWRIALEQITVADRAQGCNSSLKCVAVGATDADQSRRADNHEPVINDAVLHVMFGPVLTPGVFLKGGIHAAQVGNHAATARASITASMA